MTGVMTKVNHAHLTTTYFSETFAPICEPGTPDTKPAHESPKPLETPTPRGPR
jgi:hypothetical protein